ncbi:MULTISPECIES: hypothetical protein [Haloarcula]|uniref:Uncharacterized protein n=1 Tax=Haloarcula pellucida TaxID=1427151 RepID=A0A830GFV3_9EURY|nr:MULTISPECIES: hypothetical protein [Halomicroarcula]MBX0346825.1 hypothetical protein [Halomicroarcula pellucida]MDS0277301.1 hypothetical protein [Halomicroarcula sp. S1AR25-4]GGN85661.1 hypothetical protein GCM10009030_02450 [Halomicroarcula pellucida]
MSKLRCQRAGAVAAFGGLLWVGWTVALGVTGRERDWILVAVSLSALGVVAGHYAVESFHGARMKRPGTGGAWLGAAGGVVFAAGQLLRALTGVGEVVVGLGVLALVGGSLLTSVGLVRTRVQPPWLGVSLAVGTVAFLGFDLSTWAALPYGLAWLALGQDLYRYDPPDGRFGDANADYGWLG